MKRNRILVWLLMATILLTGCSMRTIDQMYCLPKRSEAYLNLQSAIDGAMSGLSYHAPIGGEHQQPVQMVDLDGDGNEECLVFAKGEGERPLKVLIFTLINDAYVLTDRLENYGTAFDQVQYLASADTLGCALVIGTKLSDQIVRPVSIYSMTAGKMNQLLTTQYSRFLTTDLDADGNNELMILRPGADAFSYGIAQLYTIEDGAVSQSQEAMMTVPVDMVKRITVNTLEDGIPAVYVESDAHGAGIATDIFVNTGEDFTNLCRGDKKALCNYYIYADDMNGDGILDLPALVPATDPETVTAGQHMIRWYNMNVKGKTKSAAYTYHCFNGGWYLSLPKNVATSVQVVQLGNSYEFSVTGDDGSSTVLMTIYMFTGQQREELANSDNRFVLHRNESTVFAGHLEVASTAYNLSQEVLLNSFHLIPQNQVNAEI